MEQIFCRNCKTPVASNAVICTGCGAKPLSGNKYCFNCGADTNPLAIVCIKCGVSLKQTFDNKFTKAANRLSFWVAIIMFIAFFLPWLNFSELVLSGWNMRDLIRAIIMYYDKNFSAATIVNLIYIIPVMDILIVSSFFTDNAFIKKRVSSFKMLCSMYPFFFLLQLYTSDLSKVLKDISDFFGYGFYITVACAIFFIVDVIRSRKAVNNGVIEKEKRPPMFFYKPEIVFNSSSFWAVAVMLIAFFLPWLDFSSFTISGGNFYNLNEAYSTFYGNVIPFPKIINVVYVIPILYILIILSFFSNSKFLQKGAGVFKVLSGIFPFLLLLFSFSGLNHFNVSWGLYLMMPAALYLLISGFKKKREVSISDDNASEASAEYSAVDLNDEFMSEKRQNRRRKTILTVSIVGFLTLTFFGIYYFSRPAATANTNEQVTSNQNDSNQSTQDTTTQSSVQNNQPTPAPVTNTQTETNSSQPTQPTPENNNTPSDNAGVQQPEGDETYFVQNSESYFYNQPDCDYKRRGHVLAGDAVVIKKISDDGLWGYAIYTSSNGSTTEGW